MLEPGDTLLDFDIGRTADGQPVDCVTSTRAYYAVRRDGLVLRISYWDVTQLQAEPRRIRIATAAATHTFEFAHPRKSFADAVKVQATAGLAEKALMRNEGRLFEATWHAGCARFVVRANGRIEARVLAAPSPSAELDQEILEHAWSELELGLGRDPSFPHKMPAPAWIPAFTWDPPLPPNHP